MKKGEIKPRDWIISVGIFMVIMAIGIQAISGADTDSPGYISDTQNFEAFNNTFSRYQEYVDQLNETNEEVSQITAGESNPLFNFINVIFNRGWETLRQLSTNFAFLTAILSGLSGAFGVPLYITATFIALVTAIFTFSILAVIFNRDI